MQSKERDRILIISLEMKSNNKVALITGSATGVGAATSIKLARDGWNVVINYSKSQAEAKRTASECGAFGNDVIICKANVADDDQCKNMVHEVIDRWGRIDALVNNAGTTKFCSYDDLDGLSKDDFLNLYAVNVVSAYQMSRATKPYLKKSKDGVIVNTSSISAISGVGSSMAYAASKGALSTLTLSLAHALAPDIRVNAVCPGFIQGRWTKGFLGARYEEVKKSIEKRTLLNKTSLPEDVADAIVFLIQKAGMLTEQILTIDGGGLINQSKLG